VPAGLLEMRQLKPALKLLFLALWNEAGAEPSTLTTSSAHLAALVGCDDRRIREWIPRLGESGLIDVIDRSGDGQLIAYVYPPQEVARGRVRKPDPQQWLFDDPDDAAEGAADSGRNPAPDSGRNPPTPSRDTTPRAPGRARSSRLVSSRDGEMVSNEMIKAEWPSLRRTFQEIRDTLHCREPLSERDYALFVRLAYLARAPEGRKCLDAALNRVREIRPQNRVACLLAVFAYLADERESGRYPETREAKAKAKHRLGEVLRKIQVPSRHRREPTENRKTAEQVPTPEEREETRQFLRAHGPLGRRSLKAEDESDE
jgi:hypothetical protein